MDVPRKDAGRKRLIRRITWITVLVITIPLITWSLSRLKPAAPSVEAATLWPDTVKRGPMKRGRYAVWALWFPKRRCWFRPIRMAAWSAGWCCQGKTQP